MYRSGTIKFKEKEKKTNMLHIEYLICLDNSSYSFQDKDIFVLQFNCTYNKMFIYLYFVLCTLCKYMRNMTAIELNNFSIL